MNPFQNVVNALSNFFSLIVFGFNSLIGAIDDDDSMVLLTFIVAFPLAFLGVWIIKKIIRVKDPD